MRKSIFVAAAAAGLFLGACDGEPSVRISRSEETRDAVPMRAVETLRCPEQQGALTRTATGPDGLSCTYSGPRGAQVTLRLVRLGEGEEARAALGAIEAELGALMPETVARATSGAAPQPPEAPEAPEAPGRERVDVMLPGLTVRTDGDRAIVRLPGITIDADESSSSVQVAGVHVEDGSSGENVHVSGRGEDTVSIRARNDAAEIRTSSGEGAVRATYILVDEQPSAAGWRLAGYEARGPSEGPLVVAVVLSKNRRQDNVFDAAKDLVGLNVGE